MLAAILTCGSMFTSCISNEDSPMNLAPAFITTKMVLTSVSTEEGNQVMTVTDSDGNSYGKMTLVPSANTSNGAQLQYLLDEELQANFQEKSGMKMPIAKISFFVAEAEPAAE